MALTLQVFQWGPEFPIEETMRNVRLQLLPADWIAVTLTVALSFSGIVAHAQANATSVSEAATATAPAAGTNSVTTSKALAAKRAKAAASARTSVGAQTTTPTRPAVVGSQVPRATTAAKPTTAAHAAGAARPVAPASARAAIAPRVAKTTGVQPTLSRSAVANGTVATTAAKSKQLRKPLPQDRSQLAAKRAVPATKIAANDATTATRPGTAYSTTVVPVATKPEAPPTLSLITQVARSHSLYDHQDGSVQDANDYILVPTWRFAEKWKATAILDYTQNLQDPSASDWSDALFTVSHKPWQISDTFNFGLGVAGTYALSKTSTLVKTSHGGIGGVASLGFNDGVLPAGFMLGTSVSLLRMVQDTQEGTDGSVNKAWSSIQTLKSGYSYGKLGLTVVYYHINGLTYQNNLTEAFWHVEEIGYDITKTFNFAIGHTLQGPALRANAIDSNVRLTDENNSLVYAQLTISL